MSNTAKQKYAQQLLNPYIADGVLSMEEAVTMLSPFGELDPYSMNTDSYRDNVKAINANRLFLPSDNPNDKP